MPTGGESSNWLTEECRFYAKKYGYPEDAFFRGLEGYAAHLFVQEPAFDELLDGAQSREANLTEYICRSNDLQIDAVLEDSDNQRILLVQTAWRKKNAQQDEDKIASFFDSPSRIMSGDYKATGGDQIQELLRGFNQKVEEGWLVILRYATNASVGNSHKLTKLADLKSRAYENSGLNMVCELMGESELRVFKENIEASGSKGLTKKVNLSFQLGKIFEFEDPYRTLVGAIKANELVRLYNTRGIGDNLFNLNVRFPLDTKGVNPTIVDTASSQEKSHNFFYYNNGVSAVCSSYVRDSNKVSAERFQVINGAQTIKSLVKAHDINPHNEAYVLLRLTETEESYGGKFTENIIRYNNTQNPVVASDFYSNDPIQIWLRDNLPKISGRGPIPNFYYIHKAGYKPQGATGAGLKIDEFGKIRHAFLHGPIQIYKAPKDIFVNTKKNEVYWQAFGIENRKVEFWSEEDLFKAGAAIALNKKVLDLGKKLKSDPLTKDTEEARYLTRLRRYVMALVAAGLEAIREDTFHDYATLTASTMTFNQYVEPILTKARDVLRMQYMQRKAARPEQQPEYNLARDLDVWKLVKPVVVQGAIADIVSY